MKKLIWIGLAFFVVLVGCDLATREFYLGEGAFPDEGKGMLVLNLDGSGVATKTIAPTEAAMTIASYDIAGSHLTASPFNDLNVDVGALVGGIYYERNNLAPGEWTINVIAKNSVAEGQDRIGFGSTTINVTPNILTSGSVDVLPDVGLIPTTSNYYDGLLSLQIIWADGSVPLPLVVATLTDSDGILDLAFGDDGTTDSDFGNEFDTTTAPATTATLTDYPLNSGYYTLSLELFANNTATAVNKIMGDAVSIRIVSDMLTTTSGEWDLTGTSGEISMAINPDLKNPITVTITNITASSTSVSARADLTDLPTPTPDTYNYEWYIDGIKVGESGSTAEIFHAPTLSGWTPALPDGDHNLSVVVTAYFGANVHTVSSETEPFTLP